MNKKNLNKLFNIYLALLSLVLLNSLFPHALPTHKIIYFFTILIILAPMFLLLINLLNLKGFIKFVIYLGLFDLTLFLSFRFLRTLFPLPEILGNKIIGYAQYFGYPIYFDNLVFIILFFIPALIFLILFNKKR
ncbi:MAG: hypothetical protein Q7R31_03260 [Candidatus Levybacteria bacterium]|nr:hypothetical protein [Candidatus Levybacteria bacterium]